MSAQNALKSADSEFIKEQKKNLKHNVVFKLIIAACLETLVTCLPTERGLGWGMGCFGMCYRRTEQKGGRDHSNQIKLTHVWCI